MTASRDDKPNGPSRLGEPFPPDRRALIGMVHVGAIPGSPYAEHSSTELAARAADEARLLAGCGFDAVIIENMHDRPYLHGAEHGPETTAVMTRVALAARAALDEAGRPVPLGIQILSGASVEALAVAAAVGLDFIRCENFVFAEVADEGVYGRAESGRLLRERRRIGGENVRIFADVKKKHASHAITADVSLEETVSAAEFFGADGVIVTGVATARPTDPADAATAREATTLPVLVGSGVSPESVGELFAHADGLIVGSWFKRGGVWSNDPDESRCRDLVAAADEVRR